MAGIYFHIPWCRKVCIYCDFHFSVSLRNKDELLECMLKEIVMQRGYLEDQTIETIYFGGGTPSVLIASELHLLIDKVFSQFNVSENAEISIEVNPDDLTFSYLQELKSLGINRLSIGVQSFAEEDLVWMNRRHDGTQALKSIENSRKAGFSNISIDLIYGLPGMKLAGWKNNLDIAFKNKIQHLSAYHLTLENKTVYAHKIRKGLMKEPDETGGLDQYELLMDRAAEEGFEHYEISNFSLPGFYSRHNTSYWFLRPYLGIGPSANSFNGTSRQWNIRNNSRYISSIQNQTIPCEIEQLDIKQRYNEYIMTSLRTMWGIDTDKLGREFGKTFREYFFKEASRFFNEGKLETSGNIVKLTRKGKFFADGIMSELFLVAG